MFLIDQEKNKMKKKKDEFYFKNLYTCAQISLEAAKYLKNILISFDAQKMDENLAGMHELEQKADAKKHKMMKALGKAFITPIEREDLVAISNYLDDIMDSIEDVLIEIHICGIDEIRNDILEMIDLLMENISALMDVLSELKDFKHSKKIEEYIIRVNDLEEDGDRLYVRNMKKLYDNKDAWLVVSWRSIYAGLENCMDQCEHAADAVSMVIMKNS